MNGMIQMLVQQVMSGQMQNSPQMQMFQQMMQGKNRSEQMQTLLNLAQSRGLDVNQKIFNENDLRSLGLM